MITATLPLARWTRTRPGERAYRRADGVVLFVYEERERVWHARAVTAGGQTLARASNLGSSSWAVMVLLDELRRATRVA